MADQNVTDYTGRCASFRDEPWRCDVILTVQRVLASFSILGCCLVVFMICLFKKYRRSCPQRLILYIAISGGLDSLINAIATSESDAGCKIIGFLDTFFDFTMLLWALAVAVQLLLTMYHHSQGRRYEWAYHYIIWPCSLAMSLLPFFANKYGHSGAWCWIVHDTGWRMGVWYVPLMVILVVMCLLYVFIIVKLRKLIRNWDGTYSPEVEINKKFLKEEVRPLVKYPCVYVLLYIIPLVNRIQNAVAPDYHIFALVLMASMSTSILGAVNSLVYGLDKDTRKTLTKDQFVTAWNSYFTPEAQIGEYNTDTASSNFPEIGEYNTDTASSNIPAACDENRDSSPAVIENTSLVFTVDSPSTISDSAV